jgi:predicted acylesterase/phospholipase RssA
MRSLSTRVKRDQDDCVTQGFATAAADAAEPTEYDHPRLPCDIVMKGGITSGVVYPGAVLELAKTYRFRSIGGASAGAIAAAVVAAAEFKRSVADPNSGCGFVGLEKLPGVIAGSRGRKPFILSLFQPDRATKPLFTTAISFLRFGLLRGIGASLWQFRLFPLLAAAVSGGSICLTVFADARSAFAVAGVAAALLILVVGLGADLFRALAALAENGFGLCRLGPQVGSSSEPALTQWLHDQIQAFAGKTGGRPLTFADLWGVPEVPPTPTNEQRQEHLGEAQRRSRDARQREVDLQMMTTNLTHGRPLRLPVPFQPHAQALEDGAGGLFFCPDELANYFPPDVLDHLTEFGDPPSPDTAAHLEREAPGATLLHFPIGPDLPVVVGTRMSLSFPILISAVPLWELDFKKDPEQPSGVRVTLKRVLFSDGGITSNFPVHFFDSPLPIRPTFGLHLAGFERGEQPNPDDPSVSVSDPAPVNRPERESWTECGSMFDFLVAIKDAAQNWRDNAQARLPGFRERIVHIKLAKGEGGLNLAMKPEKIQELTDRGSYAGERLVTLFDCSGPEIPGGCRWNDHRYARYRTTMSLIERYLRSVARGYNAPVDDVTIPYEDRIREGAGRAPYKLEDDGLLEFALATTGKYLDLVAEWEAENETLDDRNVPRPSSTLRAMPPV